MWIYISGAHSFLYFYYFLFSVSLLSALFNFKATERLTWNVEIAFLGHYQRLLLLRSHTISIIRILEMYTILNPHFTVAKSFNFIILNCFSQLLFFILTHYMAYASCFPWQLKLRSGPYLAKAGGTDMSGVGTALKYLKMFVFPLDCCLWGSPELICAAAGRGGLTRQRRAWVYEMICAVGWGWGAVAYPIHLTESRAQCPSPAARHTLFPLPLYCFEPRRWSWLHKSGGNATRPVDHASCQAPPHPPPNKPLCFLCTPARTHKHTIWVWRWCRLASVCLQEGW